MLVDSLKRNTARRVLRIIGFLSFSAAAVWAVDGVTLIDQKAAQAGKVTPGDTPGFPITISQPGSYKLSGNLVVPDPNTTAIQILADDVTLDLNGFSIIGPNTCVPNPTRCTYTGGGGLGIEAVTPNAPSPVNVRVMNGVVRGMGGHGIRMMGDNTRVERVHSTMNGGPGIVVGDGSIVDSVATLNASGAAMVGTVVRGSMANYNTFGIFVRPGGVAMGNVAHHNVASGISVNNATAIGNTAYSNGSAGIDATCPGTLTSNTAYQNASVNIRTNGACTLADNSQ